MKAVALYLSCSAMLGAIVAIYLSGHASTRTVVIGVAVALLLFGLGGFFGNGAFVMARLLKDTSLDASAKRRIAHLAVYCWSMALGISAALIAVTL